MVVPTRETGLRIVLACPGRHPRDGGPPRVVSGSAVALARAGLSLEIAALGEPQDDAETHAAWPELAQAGIPLHLFPRDAPAVIGYSGAMKRFMTKAARRCDVLHVHCIWEKALADAAAAFRARGRPVLVSPHGMLDRWQMRRSGWKKTLARRFLGTGAMLNDAAMILYGTADEAVEAASLSLPGQVVLMPNGVSPIRGLDRQAATTMLHERFPVMADWARTVLFFSRLHPKKGLDLLVEAFARVQPDFPDAGLLAVAIPQDGSYEAQLRARIAALRPINIVLTTELVGPDARMVFAAADIFSLPSHQEGFSIAIVEAASAGLPELITEPCHMSEIADERAGLVVPPTIDGLEDGLRCLLATDEDMLVAMGQRGAAMVAARYTWERVAERLVTTYRDAVASDAAA